METAQRCPCSVASGPGWTVGGRGLALHHNLLTSELGNWTQEKMLEGCEQAEREQTNQFTMNKYKLIQQRYTFFHCQTGKN